jgi:mRNA interferase HigB
MRIISHRIIVEYYKKHTDTKNVLELWYHTVKAAEWKNVDDIKQYFNSVDNIGNKRYVFNIKGNKYRIVAKILFIQRIVYIRFIGTHAEYDKIDCSTI